METSDEDLLKALECLRAIHSTAAGSRNSSVVYLLSDHSGGTLMSRVGLDLDETLVHFTRTFQAYVLNKYPDLAEFIPDVNAPAQKWDWFEDWGWTRDQFILEMESAVDSGELFWIGELYESDARQNIARLRQAGHTIVIVTHRFSGRSSDATHHWVNNNLGWVQEIILAKDKTSAKCDYFLEDNIDNYDALERDGVNAYLINRPHNFVSFGDFGPGRERICGPVPRQRVDTFSEFVDIVLQP